MIDRRRKDREWVVTNEQGELYTGLRDGVSVALLMDIRDELKRLNTLLHCHNFVGIPATLRTISRKMPVRRRVRP